MNPDGVDLVKQSPQAFAGRRLARVAIEAPSREPYFPGTSPLGIELFFDQRSGRVLGAEVAGADGVDKRADVLATAIAAGLTVEQLARLDLAYAPPYSTPRDPVNVAAIAALAVRAKRPAR